MLIHLVLHLSESVLWLHHAIGFGLVPAMVLYFVLRSQKVSSFLYCLVHSCVVCTCGMIFLWTVVCKHVVMRYLFCCCWVFIACCVVASSYVGMRYCLIVCCMCLLTDELYVAVFRFICISQWLLKLYFWWSDKNGKATTTITATSLLMAAFQVHLLLPVPFVLFLHLFVKRTHGGRWDRFFVGLMPSLSFS